MTTIQYTENQVIEDFNDWEISKDDLEQELNDEPSEWIAQKASNLGGRPF